jgi:HlyD family secretion protein
VLHPVVEVLGVPGARVKKDQPLVIHDADEPKADVRNKEAALKEAQAALARLKAEPRQEAQDEARANLEAASINAREAKRHLDRITPLWHEGAISEQRHHESQASLSKAQAEERAAKARLGYLLRRPFEQEVAEQQARVAAAAAAVEAAKAELEHYTLTSPIDGVVIRLDVSPGLATRPGTSVWGEVLDLRELDVRCDLTSHQLEGLSVGQSAEVCEETQAETKWRGRLVAISQAADPATGRVPVLVRVDNPQERLRCYVPVRVRFAGTVAANR